MCFLYLQGTESESLSSQAGGTGQSVISCDADGSRRKKKQTLSDSEEKKKDRNIPFMKLCSNTYI